MKQCMDADNLHRRLKKIFGQVNAIDREGHINHCIKEAFEKSSLKEIENFTKAIERFANMQLEVLP